MAMWFGTFRTEFGSPSKRGNQLFVRREDRIHGTLGPFLPTWKTLKNSPFVDRFSKLTDSFRPVHPMGFIFVGKKCHFKAKFGQTIANFKATLPETNIALENPPFWWYLPGNLGIFYGHVSLTEGNFYWETKQVQGTEITSNWCYPWRFWRVTTLLRGGIFSHPKKTWKHKECYFWCPKVEHTWTFQRVPNGS